jgi:hypothetical protein
METEPEIATREQLKKDHHEVAAPVANTAQVCPKCGHTQPEGEECARCGIIFRKFQSASGSSPGTRIGPSSVTFYDLARERRQWILFTVLLIILVGLLHHIISTRDIKHPPGVLAAAQPQQVMIRNPHPWQMGKRLVVPLAQFRVQARVLSTERYRFDPVADLAPIDVALGWGPMSDQKIVDQLEIGQGSRRYVLLSSHNQPSLPMGVLLANSANMHMIPANNDIKNKLLALRRGNIIDLSGYLIGVQENGQWTWVSSLSRTDTGDGACEIVWVEHLDVH